ncbi:hypothetical protein PY546_17955 [Providencia stuartii]|nr:hypothetical protein [Providencia stuartii]
MRLFITLIYFLLISAIPALLGGDISLLSKLAITVTGALVMLLCAGIYRTLAGKIITVFVTFFMGAQPLRFIFLLSKTRYPLFLVDCRNIYQHQ